MAVSRKPPRREVGLVGWLRKNLFSSISNTVLTVLASLFIFFALYSLLSWILFDAHWERVWVNLRLFAVFRYPEDQLWRPLAALALCLGLLGATTGLSRRTTENPILRGVFFSFSLVAALLTVVALLFWESVRWSWLLVSLSSVAGYIIGMSRLRIGKLLPWLWAASFPIIALLLYGFMPGEGLMRVVPAKEWGGFLLTLVLTTGVIPSFPIGVALALGRRSELPAIKYFCIAVIEIVRGAPLIMWLFVASLLLPLLLNVDANSLPSVMRAYVAITLFSAAYMAENVRGGLQAVPRGQTEAAKALGLSGWQTTRLIVLPQALRAVIPAIVGQSIALFKDTSLVFIVGLTDFFTVANVVASQTESLLITGGIRLEVSLFIALVYWFVAFRMSVASRQLEQKLGVGER
ncbi:MAG: amino acid ABC transporter permease [Trueperaceae bacterium]|nr:MAG: amino acid ABC transporter permease [Trueperaceae bacterium]